MDEWREIDFNCKKYIYSKESSDPVKVILQQVNIQNKI